MRVNPRPARTLVSLARTSALVAVGLLGGASLSGCPLPEEAQTRFGSELHKDPARCGAVPYQWLDDPSLGELLSHEEVLTFSADDLQGLTDGLKSTFLLSRPFTHAVSVERVLYTTQDRGKLVEATGAIAFPAGAGPFPVILWEHGTTGYVDRCAPSATADQYLSSGFIMTFLVAAIAGWGYIVVAPDFIGLKSVGEPSEMAHPYLIGEPTAIASLDMLTTADQLADIYGVARGPLAVAGASQGGHAAAFVVRYQPHYAPNRHITGAAYLIPPTDFVAHGQRALESGGDADAVHNFTAVMYAMDQWYAADEMGLARVMPDDVAARVKEAIEERCDLPDLDYTVEEIFHPHALEKAREPDFGGLTPWDCYVRENSLLDTSVPMLDDVPALVVIGTDDTLVNPAVERAAFTKHCENGMSLWLVECQDQDHGGAVLASVDEIMDFLVDRLDGNPLPADACEAPPARLCRGDPRSLTE
jgi:acetyl esterase/lipase